MRRLLLLTGLLVCLLNEAQPQQQQQKWNRQMQLRKCSIDIKAGQFVATTFVEMEFYNPNTTELEGLYQFELKPGQVITAFQLELNGKFRDGTLEEKWKATNAYNRIVGKRIDPALLTMDYANHYSLRIYPVPGMGSRKITFTIFQKLSVEDHRLHYTFPLNIADTVKDFTLAIAASMGKAAPKCGPGLIEGMLFGPVKSAYELGFTIKDIVLNGNIGFSVPLEKASISCMAREGNLKYFAVRTVPPVDNMYKIQPAELTVFWDASGSVQSRNTNTEISFLKAYLSEHNIKKLSILPFNTRLLDTAVFYFKNGENKSWEHYLEKLNYDGATRLSCIQSQQSAKGVYMIFTDGRNTYGNKIPRLNGGLVYCINSARNADMSNLNQVVGANGGKLIDLSTRPIVMEAIRASNWAENWLIKVRSSSGKISLDQSFPMKLENGLVVSGTLTDQQDTLWFYYGNDNNNVFVEKLVLPAGTSCTETGISRMNMLGKFEKLITTRDWEKILDFGLEENIVTTNTAYIVLERIEDYIKYNIEAPKELQQECEILRYVKSDTRKVRQQLRQRDAFTELEAVVNVFNQRLQKMDRQANTINLTRQEFDRPHQEGSNVKTEQKSSDPGNMLAGKVPGMSISQRLDEVVVTGYGVTRKQSMTGAVSIVRSNEIYPLGTIEQALQGRVAGLEVDKSKSGAPGSSANIIIRGSRSFNGSTNPLFIVDNIPVNGDINEVVDMNSIQDITVLKDASAAALYGARAANGVIIIRTKKGSNNYYQRWSKYRLKDMEDVEYLQLLKAVPVRQKQELYRELQKVYGSEPGFNFDMAQYFFEAGLKKLALRILMNATEQTNGTIEGQLAVAYILESWKMFGESIEIYEQLVQDDQGNISLRRDLAWAYYQVGNHQQAVDVLYAAIILIPQVDQQSDIGLKATIMYEMNAMIQAHKNELNLDKIPLTLIKEIPSDLRIVLDCNKRALGSMKVKEPGGKTISANTGNSISGAIIYGNDTRYSGYQRQSLVYQLKNALPGKYKISLQYYGYYNYSFGIPTIVRVKTFKNFGKINQSIEVENVVMDNQYGEVEIALVQMNK